MKKVKVILCAVVLSLGLSSAQAGNFIKRHPILSGAAVLAIGAAVHHSQNQKSTTPPYRAEERPQNDLGYPADEMRSGTRDNRLEYPADLNNPNLSDSTVYTPEGRAIDTSTEFPIEQPRSWEEYLTLKSNSQELANNMEQAGLGKKPPGYAAHHIVPATDPQSQIARDILASHGIDINDAMNGVYLPTTKAPVSSQGIEHNGRHPKEYSRRIELTVKEADNIGGRQEVLNQLNIIKSKLQTAPRDSKWSDIL